MQREADALVGTLRGFVDQPDYPTLVLGGNDASMALPARTLDSFDVQDQQNYYLTFPGPCPSAGKYVDGIVESLGTQREAFSMELEARGLQPLPAWPLEVQDSRYPPARRLRALIEYLGAQLPPGSIVWGLLPSEIGDFKDYKALITPLLCENGVEPWMERQRFIVRDREPGPVIIPELYHAKNNHVLVMEIDFSNERSERGLNATAADKSAPADQRMFAFFQLGAIDFAFKRFPEALAKFGHCFNYFYQKGNKPLAALCLKNAGDVKLRAGQPLDALKRYQQSIAVSMEDKNLVTLQQGLYSAGDVSLQLGNAADAEGYLEHASAVSGKLNNTRQPSCSRPARSTAPAAPSSRFSAASAVRRHRSSHATSTRAAAW